MTYLYTDEEVYHTPFVSLRKMTSEYGTYYYSHETRCDGELVSILPFRFGHVQGPRGYEYEYLLRKEITPCWSTMPILSSITGGIDEGSIPIDTAVKELLEESGYSVPKKRMIDLGQCFGTKSSSNTYYLYTVDLTGETQNKITGDGSKLESVATCEWVGWSDIIECLDPLVSVSFVRMETLLFLK